MTASAETHPSPRRVSSWALRAAIAATALLAAGCQTNAPNAAAFVDHPEPGRQGEVLPEDARVLPQPYSMGMRVVGHEPIQGRPGNVQLSWIDHCAYVSSSAPGLPGGVEDSERNGVAVIDVSDPSAPRLVRVLRDNGSLHALETMHAVDAGDRKVLVAGSYRGGNPAFRPDDPPWLDIYDASDCENPRLMAEYRWPQNSHTLTLSPDGRRVYGTNQTAFTGNGALQVLDITDLANPRFMGRFGVTTPDGRTSDFNVHEFSFSADERRIYAAVSDSKVGDFNVGIPEGPRAERLSPEAGGVYIIDNSDIVEGRANPQLRLISSVPHGGWHSVMPANINGVPYLVGGGEIVACPGAVPKIINIADEAHPFIESEFRLVMNHAENCPPPAPGASPFATALGIGPPSATLHYNDVDSAARTQLGLFNFSEGGLRIADLRDPRNPTEIAYFRPGDWCTGHVRYFPESGQIWSICNESGFWVTQLSPEIRTSLRRSR